MTVTFFIRFQLHKKNTRAKIKRKKDMKKLKKQKKKAGGTKKKGRRAIDFSAIHLLHDPDGKYLHTVAFKKVR